MKGLDVYFTWPLFLIRLTIAVLLIPVFLAGGFVIGTWEYFHYRDACRTYKQRIVNSIQKMGQIVGWFILGGFRVLIP